MDQADQNDAITLDFLIEELECKIAPDSGETVCPLGFLRGRR